MYSNIEQIVPKRAFAALAIENLYVAAGHPRQDNIIIVRPRGAAKKYDVPVYRTQHVRIHRIVQVHPEVMSYRRQSASRICYRRVAFAAWSGAGRKAYVDCKTVTTYRWHTAECE